MSEMPRKFRSQGHQVFNVYLYISRNILAVGISDSISTTQTHNRISKVNLYNLVACREFFVITLLTLKPMIEGQMPLHKTDGVAPTSLCNFMASILKW